MKISIVTFGSRGDVEPYIALGVQLQKAGHQVKLVSHVDFEAFIHNYGLDFYPTQGNLKELIEGEVFHRFLDSGENPIRFMRSFSEYVARLISDLVYDCSYPCKDSDFILYNPIAWFAVHPTFEKFGIPYCAAYLQPVSPTREFPSLPFPINWKLGRLYNLLSYPLGNQFGWQMLRPALNQARRDVLDLPALPVIAPFDRMNRSSYPILYGFSSHVVPKPADWGDWLYLTGYWFLDQSPAWQPPDGLLDFLQSGPPPVYIGFGSMKERQPEQTTKIVLQAVKMSGQRAILSAGWAGLGEGDLPDAIYRVESVPHSWLFPQMCAVIHHGGAGTTASGLRAGRPTITVPFFADQFFWGYQAYHLGAALKPIDHKKLDASILAAAIRRVAASPDVRHQAEKIGSLLRCENGAERAVEILEQKIWPQKITAA